MQECVSAGVGVGGGVGLWVKLQWALVRVCLDSIYHKHKALIINTQKVGVQAMNAHTLALQYCFIHQALI